MSLLIHCKDTTVFLISNSFDKKKFFDVHTKTLSTHVTPKLNCTQKVGHKTNYYERV